MKKLNIILLTMVITVMFVISPLYATEAVEAATATYTTEKDSEKIYFPLNRYWTNTLKLPLNYRSGSIGGKTFYELGCPIISKGYNESYKFSYNTKLINVKSVYDKTTEKTHIVVAPKSKGTTVLKITVTKDGFNKVVFSTKITVTSKELDWNEQDIKDIYRTEFSSKKSGVMPEYSKLFLYDLNKERKEIKLADEYNTPYTLKLAEETIKLINQTKTTPKTVLDVKSDKLMDVIAKERVSQLVKAGKIDNHEGFADILENTNEYSDYYVSETLYSSNSFSDINSMMEGYIRSTSHWNVLSDYKVNLVSSYTFKTSKGKLINVTVVGVKLDDAIGGQILDFESEYEYLMNEKEKEEYGIEESYDDYEDYDDSDGAYYDYDWDI